MGALCLIEFNEVQNRVFKVDVYHLIQSAKMTSTGLRPAVSVRSIAESGRNTSKLSTTLDTLMGFMHPLIPCILQRLV